MLFSEVGLLAFSDAVLEGSSTQSLRLRGLGLGHAASTALLELLLHPDGELRDVRALDLTDNALRSFGVAQLLKAVQRPHSRIAVLALGDNRIGGAAITEMATALIDNTRVSSPARTRSALHRTASLRALMLALCSALPLLCGPRSCAIWSWARAAATATTHSTTAYRGRFSCARSHRQSDTQTERAMLTAALLLCL